MDRKAIQNASIQYRAALLDELDAQGAASEAVAAFESAKMVQLQQGYDDGEIKGKNAADRERSEFLYLDGSPNLDEVLASKIEAEHQLALTIIERKVIEVESGLIKAWLYSHAQIG